MPEIDPQCYWDVCMMQAQAARNERHWRLLDTLLRDARQAPDAPSFDMPPWKLGEQARTWTLLYMDLMEQVQEAARLRVFLDAVLETLIQRARDRLDGPGVANPTAQELCAWLLREAETFDMFDLLEAAPEDRGAEADETLDPVPLDDAD
jgi:hypothetical protein